MPSLGLPLHPEVLVHHNLLFWGLWNARDPFIRVGVGLSAGGEDDDVGVKRLAALAGVGAPADEVPAAWPPVPLRPVFTFLFLFFLFSFLGSRLSLVS